MGDRVYIQPIVSTAIGTAVQDIVALIATANIGLVIHQIHLSANVSAEAALRIRLKRATATLSAGSAGSAGAPIPVDPADHAVTASARLNDTTQSTTSGAFTTLWEEYWDTALPFDYLPAPEDRPTCVISGGFVLDLAATIAATTIGGYIKFAEKP